MPRCASHCLLGLLTLCLVNCHTAAAQDLNWAQKMFDTLNHDFGTVARGASVVHKIKLKNVWQPTVQISGVATSCQCISARVVDNKQTLASLDTAEIELTVNTRQYSRDRQVNLTVTFAAPNFVQVVIPVHVYIRTDVVLEPGSVNFGSLTMGEAQERHAKIDYAGQGNWQIVKAESKNPNLEVAVKETFRDPNGGRVQYDLVVKSLAKLEPGELREYITLTTTDVNTPTIPILVEGRVDAEFVVTPNPLVAGNLRPGDQKVINVVIRSRKPFAVEKIESESGSEAFQIRLPAKDKQNLVHVLPLTIVAPNTPGPLTESFSLTVIGGTAKTVDFKLVGKVIDPAGESSTAAPAPVTTAKPTPDQK